MRPYVIAAGLGRCGSSMTMQMLAAGGMACIGTAPDYEVREIAFGRVPLPYLVARQEHAFKLVTPNVIKLPPLNAVVLWLDRDEKEQARSQAKFLAMTLGKPMPNREQLRHWARGLRQSRALARGRLSRFPMLTLRFEQTVRHPRQAAAEIAEFLLGAGYVVDAARMAAVVIDRDPGCAGGLEIETAAAMRMA